MDDVLIDISFYVIFASIPFLAMELLPYSGVSLRRFSIPSVFIIFYFFSAYVGILPLYFQWDPYRVTLGVVDRTILLKMLLYSGAALIMTRSSRWSLSINGRIARPQDLVAAPSRWGVPVADPSRN